ncbi:S8 family serine peptidase [Arthrobacter nitrophenolicus]|uniref:Peptidase S8/S53 subtilisin kexin sedolisin n=2 Tax=Arthrobacter nitrophenolicus TaxID=683150 RepID=L8TJ10_9MICC|nr:S8 family serine peptidase [Arthrobacter nitrophenolicus]ELT43303.1 peptidase S8/S53 subtilisin kexin sedolisin [Arthrobacter nitrophenolicus]
MKKLVLAGFAAVVMVTGTLLGAAVPAGAAADPAITAGQILVKFRDGGAAAGVLRQHGLVEGPGVGSTGAHVITVPTGKELQLIEALSRNPVVEYAEPDYVVTAASDDTYFSRQYALQNDGQTFTNTAGTIPIKAGKADADVDAVEAWKVTNGNGTKVAVLDSGVATDNPDIHPKVVARANFTTSRNNEDNYGHGTHVAGIVAATADNGIGVAGVCRGCTILDGKVLTDSGMGSSSGLANGINWAVKSGAKVINMSLAVGSSTTLQTAVNNAWNAGVVLVAAAGNGNSTTMMYPGAYVNVIAVGATDNEDLKASFSTYGTWVDVAAPGVSVYSTFPNHRFVIAREYNRSQGYDIGSGTSMSSPIVAAVAALAWSANPGASNSEVRAKVESSTDPVGRIGTDWANGRVNADKAVHW